jgi:hypothetical protein
VINGVEGSAEVQRDKNGGFMIFGGMEDMIEGTLEGCFSGVIATVS